MRLPLPRRLATVAVAAVALGGLAACGGDDDSAGPSDPSTSSAAASALADRVQRYLVSGAEHVQGRVDYPQTPPVGGDHNAAWQNCGFYSEPIAPERAVHSLEHGAVWLTFRPSLPSDQVSALRRLARRPYVLVSPWIDETLGSPVVASAWGLQLKADTASDPAVAAFVETYASGPQTPERGAPCTGSFGTPE